MKVLLILIDGMRPDALSGLAKANKILTEAAYTWNAKTVLPSDTLPCHMSLFHSVDPSRHGITTNTYVPQDRPINGLCEVLRKANKSCAFFYNWGELRDLARPDSLTTSFFCNGNQVGFDVANDAVTDAACTNLSEGSTDFAFLYLGFPDDAGHKYGWMSKEYLAALEQSFCNVERVFAALPEDYSVIITADHGGHDRSHGTALPEDMTIPIVFLTKGNHLYMDFSNANIKDIAPTVAALLDVEPDEQWEGKSLLK